MNGILLVTHASMCKGVLESCEMIIGEKENIQALSLTEEGVENFRKELNITLENMEEKYSDVIIVTDIPNATPYNECCRYILSHKSHAHLLSGMNLTMIIELAIFSSGQMKTEELLKQVMESAIQSVTKYENSQKVL